ncbi:MAG: mucoidy inhibitor MuiA family protein [Bacteroidetes bacterium]|nr:mucoidy inhibitor MuiA family protein [Bacteroidota bacterium]
MKSKIHGFFTIFLMGSSVCSFAQGVTDDFINTPHKTNEKITNNTITKVTVFRSQAQITRLASIDANEGVHNVIFDKLSPYINMNSVEVKADQAITILSVSNRNQYLNKEEKPESIKLMEDSLENLNASLADFKADKETIVFQKELMLANKNVGSNQTGVKTDELEDLMALYHKKLNEFKTDWFRLTKLENKYNEIKQKFEQQLAEYNNGQMQLTNEIVVSIKANRELQNAKIELSYLVSNVSWQPFYDIRIKDTKSPVNIMCKAKVTQGTGEDWKNVMLKLTTANPAEGGNKPELQTNWLRFFVPQVLREVVIRDKPMLVAPKASNMQMADDAVSESYGVASVSETAINTEFIVNAPYSIPSDNAPHSVDLNVLSLPADYIYQAVPKLDKDVFVTARVAANDVVNNLQGEANVYFDGTFTGNTYINSTAEDTLTLSLGRDKRIQIERKKLKEFSSKSFFGSTKTESNTWEITIRNTRKEPVKIFLEDQVPVSTDKEIEVKITDAGNANIEDASGKLTWTFNIPAEQTQTAKFSFEVKYPKDKKINSY